MEFGGQGQTLESVHSGLRNELGEQSSDVNCKPKAQIADKTSNSSNQSCKCDSGTHVGNEVQTLGQDLWLGISKKQLAQLDLQAIPMYRVKTIYASTATTHWVYTTVPLAICGNKSM